MRIRIYPLHHYNDDLYDEWSEKADGITDYTINKNNFVVRRGDQWMGIYNLDDISKIIVSDEKVNE